MYNVLKNEIFARHLLPTQHQQVGETLDGYLNTSKVLAKDSQFKAVTAQVYKQEMIRDAFINGILSQHIHLRLLESNELTLDSV